MAAPDERAFVIFNRGVVRDQILLAHFRTALQSLVNPETGVAFTLDEIERATQPGTRFYIEADAIDLFGMAQQQRGLFFVSQIDPRRANTEYLETEHGRIWLGPNSKLPATGGTGPILATGTPGTVVPGGATIPDPSAAVATDPNGNRYQNLTTEVIDANGEITLTLKGIDTGFDTNLPLDTELRWSANTNPGTDPSATVTSTFIDGNDVESDQEYAERIERRIRNRPASGNATHFQAWAQQADPNVSQAFVYPVALNAGSTVVALTRKRNTAATPPEGPDVRVPTNAMLVAVANYLVAPASPVVPQRVFVVVVPVQTQQTDMTLRITMTQGRAGGWADVTPWPSYTVAFPDTQITALGGSPTVEFSLTCGDTLPNGAASLTGDDAPQMMIFNREVSRWVELNVASVTDAGSNVFNVVLYEAPTLYDSTGATRAIAVGDRISPFTDQHETIAESIESYFDTLGPGQVVPAYDPRYARAQRQPLTAELYPIRAGQAVISALQDALGGSALDSELTLNSQPLPDLPTNIIDGPYMITFGDTNIYPL